MDIPEARDDHAAYISQTPFNLFEGITRFVEAFMVASGDYDRFFVPVGSPTRQTPELKSRNLSQRSTDSFDSDLYDALGGDGGQIYLGDGLSIGSDGSWHDD